MNGFGRLWKSHGTKILGMASAIVAGFLTIPELIPAETAKYWHAVNVVLGVFTVQRGFTNSKRGS